MQIVADTGRKERFLLDSLYYCDRNYGGEGGIRTPGTRFSTYNGLAKRRLQPLGHLSAPNYLRQCTLSAGLELEYELGRYLHQPRVFRSDDRPEGSRRQIRAYAVGIKLRVIEDVVGLESELYSRPFRNCGVFVEHEVPVVNPGAADWISWCVAIRHDTGRGNPLVVTAERDGRSAGGTWDGRSARYWSKCTGIEPHPRGAGIQVMHWTYLIGSIPTIEVRGQITTARWIREIGDIQGEACLECGNAGNGPASREPGESPIPAYPRDLIDVADYQPLPRIVNRGGDIAPREAVRVAGADRSAKAATLAAILSEAAVFEAGSIVDGMTIGVRDEKLQAMGHLLVDAGLQGVVAGGATAKNGSNRPINTQVIEIVRVEAR